MLNDFRYGFRLLIARPGFTAVAIVILALGIGANTAIFSAVAALLWRAVPIAEPDRIVFGYALSEGDPFTTSLLEYERYRDDRSFASSGLMLQRTYTIAGRDGPQRVHAAVVTAGYLATVGVRPIIGRSITDTDDRPTAPASALIGYQLWQARFGGAPTVVGDTLRLDDGLYTIVGVLPRGFDFPWGAAIWVPLRMNVETVPFENRRRNQYEMVARLADGVTLAQANAAVKRIARQLENENPQFRRGWTYQLITLRQQLLGDFSGRHRQTLLTLEAAVGFLLLICCANVANLLLVRGVSREREIAVRLALGAAPGRIVRQLLAESTLLASIGGGAGLPLAFWLTPALASLNPIRAGSFEQYLMDFSIDRRVMAFACAASAATGLLFGIAPALKAARAGDVMTSLKLREQRSGAGGGRRWLGGIVAVEIAVAAILLVNGSLIVQSFARLQRIDLGFNPDRLLTMSLELPSATTPTDSVAFVDRLIEAVRVVPGVESVGVSTDVPLRPFAAASAYTVEGTPLDNPADVPITSHRAVSAAYLQALGVRLLRGRLLDEYDRAGSQRVVVITDDLARQAWPNADPIGKRIRRGRPVDTGFRWMTVVGVVAAVKEDRFNFRIDRPAWYVPYAQSENSSAALNVVARVDGDPASAASGVRAAVRSIDENLAVSPAETMTSLIADLLTTERFGAVLMTALASVGLYLAACGLYGVIAYSTAQRTGEIGLRMALGASRRDVVALVMRQGATVIVIGLAAGLAAARALSVLLAGVLFGVSAGDRATFLVVGVVLVAVSATACYLPAVRATRVDPLVALKTE